MFKTEYLETDVLVLGGGLAGYRAAIAARERGAEVTIAFRARGASPYVIGFNAPLGHVDDRDMPQVFFDDMIRGGYGLNDKRLARVLAYESIDAFESLAQLGVPFARGTELTTDGQRKALQRHGWRGGLDGVASGDSFTEASRVIGRSGDESPAAAFG